MEKITPWNKDKKGCGGRKRVLVDKVCSYCKVIFRPKINLRKFCSRACALKLIPKKGLWFKCKICAKSFYRFQSKVSYRNLKNRYCSQKCFSQASIKIGAYRELVCTMCAGKYKLYKTYLKKRGSKFCSMKCLKKAKSTKFLHIKKEKKLKTSVLKKQLWIYFSKYIRQRDKGVCISCGKADEWKNTDAGHYVPKTAGLSLYFDEQNVHSQCTGCNRFRHGNLSQYALALKSRYGEGILEELEKKRTQIKKTTVQEYKDLIVLYKNKILDAGYTFN